MLLRAFLSNVDRAMSLRSGTFDAITKMMHYEGLSGMYKGMGTKIVQSVFASALLFMIKEELVKGARLLVTGDTSLVKKLPSKPSR
jgi:adenine nucleotide transporter 17